MHKVKRTDEDYELFEKYMHLVLLELEEEPEEKAFLDMKFTELVEKEQNGSLSAEQIHDYLTYVKRQNARLDEAFGP